MTTPMKSPAATCPRCGGWSSHGGMSQFSKSHILVLGRVGCFCLGAKTFVFNWLQGGYNTVRAESYAAAVWKANMFSLHLKLGGVKLTLQPGSMHEAKPGELERLDREYASMFN